MRRPHPGRDLQRRRRGRARVQILEVPQSEWTEDGAATSQQSAVVSLPDGELERLWTPEYLERLARTYWRFLTRISLGLLRILYTETSREVVFLTRPFVLLRFFAPEYEFAGNNAGVLWRINEGLLVAPSGRAKGYLRIWVKRHDDGPPGPEGDYRVTVTSEVANFYPMLAGRGWFSRAGRAIYGATQVRIHVIVTHAFLRSLARLDLVPSKVGALKPPEEAPGEAPTPAARP
jgi:hypothetical protein